jgi:hypothetical protein
MAEVTAQTDALPLWSADAPCFAHLPAEQQSWQEEDFTLTRTALHTPLGDLTSTTKFTPSIKTVWSVEHLCKTEEDIARYRSIPLYLPPVDASGFAPLDAEVGERGLVLCDIADAVCGVAELFDFGEFTVFALTEPELIRELCDLEHQRVMHKLHGMLEAHCGPFYRIYGPEYCTPPYLPPRAFAEFVVPYVTEMVTLIHQYGGYARIHAHGRVAGVLDMIVATGADAIDPIEPPPDGDIALTDVKARYGDKLILFGNMELKYLEQETPSEIDARVFQMMEEAKAGGGYVLMPTAAPINVPLSPRTKENYRAFMQAGLRYGRY